MSRQPGGYGPRVSEGINPPTGGIAQAVDDLSASTQRLVRDEIQAVQREAWQRAKALAPGLAMLAAAGVFGIFAVASAYRLTLRLLEKASGPAAAATYATAGFGAVAGAAAVMGLRRLRQAPSPLPVETVRRTASAVRESVS